MSLAALERAQGAYECHLDLVPREGPLPEIGLPGRIMTSEQLFRFDPQLVDLFVGVVARMLAATAPAG